MAAWEEREKEELRLDEGVRLKAYKDTLGNWTIGVGHLLKEKPATDWTQDEVEAAFAIDFEEAENGAIRAAPFFSALDGPRKGVLVNMAFNMGGEKLAAFHGMLAAMDSGDWDTAALHLMNSRYARQVGNRAKRLAYRIRTGEYSLR